MSRVVGCVGTSHSPMLALGPIPGWKLRAEADETGVTELIDHEGRLRPYAELLDEAGDKFESELDPLVWDHKYERCMEAVQRLGSDIRALRPDLLVIIGDDQEELFSTMNNPSIAVSYSPTVRSAGEHDDDGSESVFRRRLGMNGEVHAADATAALHMIGELIAARFDVATVGGLVGGKGFGHAFTWVLGRVLGGTSIPAVPVLLNTYFPPNQPTPSRCLELGRELRRACESLPGDRRVVIVASGGLSHFVVNPELDQAVLRAVEHHDYASLEALPERLLNSGTSEIRNWIAMSGASGGLALHWMEYQQVYRTAAGTGCGLAFALLS